MKGARGGLPVQGPAPARTRGGRLPGCAAEREAIRVVRAALARVAARRAVPAEVRRAANAFRAILTRPRGWRAGGGRATAEDAGPEAAGLQAALDMHNLGVRLYRQRMHREHPNARRSEIDGMVRTWLAEPPHIGHLRLPSREQDRSIPLSRQTLPVKRQAH